MLVDLVVATTAPFVLCLSAYPLAQRFFFRSKERNLGEKLIASLIIGLAFLMLLPYGVGIILGYGVRITSWMTFFAGIFSIGVNIKTFIREARILLTKAKNYIFKREVSDLAFVESVIGFSFKYTYYLLVRAITGWDATVFYLPYARAIYFADSIPFTAFDFARFTKPMGISFLYGWIYSLGSSTLAENFRLIPLSFSFITILLIYLIAKDLCSSLVAKLAVMIYLFLPLHDSTLYYFAYYPDVAFNSLILAVFYFLYRYARTLETKYCLIGGLAFGLSMLLKAQTALFFASIVFTFLPLFGRKSVRVSATSLTPVTFLSFIAVSHGNLTPFLGLLRDEGLVVLVLVAIMSSLVALGVEAQEKTTVAEGSAFTVLEGLSIFLGASSVALVWYLRNYFTMGTFIWLSSIKEPNLQWAINILSGFISQTSQGPKASSFLPMIISVLLVHPILGSVWIIPKLVGMVKLTVKRKMLPVLNWVLGFFLSYILYAYSTIVTSSSFTVNPRDLLPLAPFFSIYSAWGLLVIAEYFWKTRTRETTLYLLASLGFVSLAQSLVILRYPPSFLAKICDQMAKLSFTSWKLLAHGGPQASSNWLIFGFVVGSLLLLPFLVRRGITFILSKMGICVRVTYRSPKQFAILKRVLFFIIILSVTLTVQVFPYVALTYEFGNGDMIAFKENQVKELWAGIYSDILPYIDDNAESGDVILAIDAALTGLQYKLDNIRLIDITSPDNLASMRILVESNDTEEIVTMLHDLNVRYFLLPKWGSGGTKGYATSFMRWLLNEGRLLHVTWSPTFSTIRVVSPGWILYEFSDKSTLSDRLNENCPDYSLFSARSRAPRILSWERTTKDET